MVKYILKEFDIFGNNPQTPEDIARDKYYEDAARELESRIDLNDPLGGRSEKEVYAAREETIKKNQEKLKAAGAEFCTITGQYCGGGVGCCRD